MATTTAIVPLAISSPEIVGPDDLDAAIFDRGRRAPA